MKKVILFLDFDGVLHPLMDKSKHFCSLPNFEETLISLKDSYQFAIVLSTTWRKCYSLDELKAFFSPEIAHLIVSVTPVTEFQGDGSRLKEAELWLEEHNEQNSAWIALDDDHYSWNRCQNLVWCHDQFDAREIELFKKQVEAI